MKAAIRTGFLGYTFTFTQNFAIPSFDPNSSKHKHAVFIKVQSAAINPVDYKLPRFIIGPIIGRDFCGVVEQVGSQVTSFQVGDQVFGNSSTGSLAEYTIAQDSMIAKTHKDWTEEECAALPVAYQSALQSLQVGNIIPKGLEGTSSGEKNVLIIGASGGCGVAGIQLCNAEGVKRIVAICSKKNTEFVQHFGATEVVNYDVPHELNDFFQRNKGQFDCVYDAATGSGGNEDYWNMSIPLLKPKVGQFVALNGPAGRWVRALLGWQKKNESIILCRSNTADLEHIINLLNKTGARPIINQYVFSEDGLAEAFKALKSRRAKGKLVFHVE
jgi:NADPH:quinone reductase-like Zn-dependent oxidoreductase